MKRKEAVQLINERCKATGADKIVLRGAIWAPRYNGVNVNLEYYKGEENVSDLVEEANWGDYFESSEMAAEMLRKYLKRGSYDDLYGGDVLKTFKGLEVTLFCIEGGNTVPITEDSVLSIEEDGGY